MRKELTKKMKKYYDSFPSYFESSKKNFENIKENFPEIISSIEKLRPKSYLDIGCGAGSLVNFVSKKYDIFSVGADISLNALKIARKGGKGNFVVCDVSNLPFKKECFDMLTSIATFEHVVSPDKVIEEIYRVSRKGCYLFIQSPNFMTIFIVFDERGVIRGLDISAKSYAKNALCFLRNPKQIRFFIRKFFNGLIGKISEIEENILEPPLSKKSLGGDIDDLVFVVGVLDLKIMLEKQGFRVKRLRTFGRESKGYRSLVNAFNNFPLVKYIGPAIVLEAEK